MKPLPAPSGPCTKTRLLRFALTSSAGVNGAAGATGPGAGASGCGVAADLSPGHTSRPAEDHQRNGGRSANDSREEGGRGCGFPRQESRGPTMGRPAWHRLQAPMPNPLRGTKSYPRQVSMQSCGTANGCGSGATWRAAAANRTRSLFAASFHRCSPLSPRGILHAFDDGPLGGGDEAGRKIFGGFVGRSGEAHRRPDITAVGVGEDSGLGSRAATGNFL